MDVSKKEYWEERYKTNDTNWDLGNISRPLKDYIDQLRDKNIRILIPGAGNAYEAEYLHIMNFRNVFVMDISEIVMNNFKNRFPDFPEKNLLVEDFFKHNGKYDLILEQTFFCAIERKRRSEYAKKVFDLLNPGGKLAGLLFNHEFEKEGPPFGGSEDEYRKYFNPYFKYKKFETAYNSIKPRSGGEIFMILEKTNPKE